MNARRLLSSIVAIMLVLALGGCTRSARADITTDTSGTLTSGGMERTYLLHLPSDYQPSRPAPLLIAFHGSGDTGSDMAELTGFDALADTHGFLVVYPNGIEKAWADRNNTFADRAGVDDVAFVNALIEQLSAQYSIDQARIYATGFSNGGFLATLLACALPDKIAAIAPVAATMPASLVQNCPSGNAVSLFLIHGQDDSVVPSSGGAVQAQDGKLGPVLSDADTVAFWATRDGCESAPAVTDLPTAADDTSTQVQQTEYLHCRASTGVLYDAVADVGHAWPGGMDFDSSAAIWSFFAAHPQQGVPATRTNVG